MRKSKTTRSFDGNINNNNSSLNVTTTTTSSTSTTASSLSSFSLSSSAAVVVPASSSSSSSCYSTAGFSSPPSPVGANKRFRGSCRIDEAIQLNQLGISRMQNGYPIEAETCFSLALYIIECSTTTTSSFATTASADVTSTATKSIGVVPYNNNNNINNVVSTHIAQQQQQQSHHRPTMMTTISSLQQQQQQQQGPPTKFPSPLKSSSSQIPRTVSLSSTNSLSTTTSVLSKSNNDCNTSSMVNVNIVVPQQQQQQQQETVASSSSTTVSTKSYMYQRHEYDEGMDVYREPLELRTIVDESLSLFYDEDTILASMLYYNVGQTHVQRRQYHAAQQAYSNAAQRLQHYQLLLQESSSARYNSNNNNNNTTSLLHYIPNNNNSGRTQLFITQLGVQIYHNLGNCYYRMDDIDKALQSYHKALQEAMKYPLPTLYTAASQNAIGVALFHSTSSASVPSSSSNDDDDESSLRNTTQHRNGCMKLFQSVLGMYQEIFGTESREVATILNNIGRVHYIQNEFHEALVAYKVALVIRRSLVAASKTVDAVSIVDLAATICNTGQAYHQLQQYDLALQHYQEFITLAQTRYGNGSASCGDHRDIAITLRCMGEIYHDQEMYNEATAYYEQALAMGRRVVGNCHPEVAVTLNKLGNLHFEQEQYDTALKYYTDGLFIEKQLLDSYHPHKIITLSNIAQIYRRKQNYSMALLTYGEIYGLQLKVCGPNSIDVANTLSNMGFMQYHLQSFKSSYELYEKTLHIQRQHCDCTATTTTNQPKCTPHDIAATLSSMGLVSFSMGSLCQALQCFTESLKLRQACSAAAAAAASSEDTTATSPNAVTTNKDLAILWYNIATVYLEQGDDEQAIKYYKEALRVERMTIDRNPHDVIMTLQHIGLVYQRRSDLEEALQYFTEALELQVTKCTPNSVAAARLYNLIGNIHLQQGNTVAMMDCYSTAVRIYNQHQPDRPDSTLIVAGHNLYGFSKIHPPGAPAA